MKDKSKTNPAPLAPTSDKPSNASSVKAKIAPVEKGTLVKKKGDHDQNPTIENHKVKPHVKQTGGAAYGITAKMPKQTSPEAGKTQSNGRILPSAVKRQKPNFSAGTAE